MKSRTVDSQDLWKNFCLAHKLTSRVDAQNKLSKVFAKAIYNEGCYAIFRANDITRRFRTISEYWGKAESALRTGRYEGIVPVFTDNACYDRGFSAMNDLKTAKATNLIRLCLR